MFLHTFTGSRHLCPPWERSPRAHKDPLDGALADRMAMTNPRWRLIHEERILKIGQQRTSWNINIQWSSKDISSEEVLLRLFPQLLKFKREQYKKKINKKSNNMPYHNYLTLSCLTTKTTCLQLPRGSVIEKNSPVKYVEVLHIAKEFYRSWWKRKARSFSVAIHLIKSNWIGIRRVAGR